MNELASHALLPEFAGFFEHAAARRLAFPYCEDCNRFHWYPMPRCPHCRGNNLQWRPISGRGEIFSFTRVTYPFDKSRADRLPYVVALVTFADAPGVRLITSIVDAGVAELRIGLPVEPAFGADENGQPIVEFSAASANWKPDA
jgi:uncharacterized protein